jgi:uncharacterized membrane protein
MSRIVLIVVGLIIAILGILALFPMMTLGLWLSIVLIAVGIVSIILGFLDKGKNVVKEEIKQEEKAENKTE